MERYAAFISYSHAADTGVARSLQSGIERYATTRLRGRSCRVFRDSTNLSASPDLWGSIVEALATSRWLVVLASPESAGSHWVGEEIAWWLHHREADSILVVLTDGTLSWSNAARDFTADSSALHPRLRGAFRREPLWVDAGRVRSTTGPEHEDALQAAIVDVTAPVRGVPKDVLRGEHLDVRRQEIRRWRWTSVTLAVLLLAVAVAGRFAWVQRDEAVVQTGLAVSRQLAASSGSLTGRDLDTAALLAVAAFRRNPNAETRSALLRAATASPHLMRFLPFSSTVTALSGSDDGRTIVTGLQDGRVTRAATASASVPEDVVRLPGAATAVATGSDGSTVLATDGRVAQLARRGVPAVPVELPPGAGEIRSVSVSPSGLTAALSRSSGVTGSGDAGSVVLLDVPTGTVRSTQPTASADLLDLASDAEILAFSRTYGTWEKRRTADWSVVSASPEGMFGTYNFAHAVARDGGTIAQSNGGNAVNVWSTSGPTSLYESPLEARAPVVYPDAIALSPNGSTLAAAEGGAITVTPVTPRGVPAGAPIPLTGVGDVNAGALQFLGDGSRLLSASGTKVAVWDLSQLDRLARSFPTAESTSCRACAGPRVVVSPTGDRAATLDGFHETIGVQPLSGGAPEIVDVGLLSTTLAPPVWSADGSRLVVPVMPPSGGSTSERLTGLPPSVSSSWPVGDGAEAEATGMASDGRVVAVTALGEILTQNAVTGEVLDRIPGPAAMGTSGRERGAISSDGAVVAVAGRGSVIVTDRDDHRTLATIPGDADALAFGGGRLFVIRDDGTVEVWSRDGATRERIIGSNAAPVAAPVINASGTLIARQRPDESADLVDVDTGAVIGTLAAVGGNDGRRTGSGFGPRNEFVSVTEPADLGPSTMTVRDLSDDGLAALACRTAGRDLSGEEWDAYAGTARPDDLSCR